MLIITQSGLLIRADQVSNLKEIEQKVVVRKILVRRVRGKIIKTPIWANLYRYMEDGKGRKILCLARFVPIGLVLPVGITRLIVQKQGSGEEIPREKFKHISPVCGARLAEQKKQQGIIKKWLLDNIYTRERQKLGRASCILVLGTGIGKTYIGIDMMRIFGRKTLIVVPSDSVLEGWRGAITEMFPNIVIGEYSCKKKRDGDIVLMVINSVAANNEFMVGGAKISCRAYFSRFGFVIYDEIHNYSSRGFRKAFWKTNFMYGLGLTATPNMRSDSMDDVYKMHMGSLVYGAKIPGYIPLRIETRKLVYPVRYYGPEEYTKVIKNPTTGDVWHLKMIQQVCSDPARNMVVVEKVKELLGRGRNVYLYFMERDFSGALEKLLKAENIGFSSDIKTLIGGAKKEDLDRAKKARVILTTYSYGWQGISYCQMDAIIFVTSQKSELKQRQTMGRILGMRGDPKKDRIIIDIIDWNTPLRGQWYRRKKVYDDPEIGFETMEYEDFHHD
jgi:superfamily II DNA or RNA helicase